jgi:hypothetical protein
MTRLADLTVLEYQLWTEPDGHSSVRLCRVAQHGPDRWAVRYGSECLGTNGKFAYEPMPSSRTDKWFAKYRFDTAEDALAAWDRHVAAYPERFRTRATPRA